jgi:hypothetical protein
MSNGGSMKLSSLLIACVLSFSSFAFSSERMTLDVAEGRTQQFLSVNFGRVWVNTMNRALLQIRNPGPVPVVREGFSISGPGYEAYTNCPIELPPGGVCDLEIRYWPMFEGAHFGRMQMLFTDRNDIIVDLYGEAYRY